MDCGIFDLKREEHRAGSKQSSRLHRIVPSCWFSIDVAHHTGLQSRWSYSEVADKPPKVA
jgi:hypothetical protein